MLVTKGTYKRQRGAAAVEFALVALVFFAVLLGIMEFGRWLFVLNSTAEATRWGARLAVVCDVNDSTIKTRMRFMVPQLADGDISIAYIPNNCSADGSSGAPCQSVSVSIVAGKTMPTMTGFFGSVFAIPPFATTLPRESMQSTNSAGEANPVCA